MNIVMLRGRLSSTAVLRPLANGGELLCLDLTTPTDAGTLSVPVVWFDPPATARWAEGTELVVTGAVKRRFFRSGGATQSRTEVVASDVLRASQRRQVRRALDRCAAVLAGDS